MNPFSLFNIIKRFHKEKWTRLMIIEISIIIFVTFIFFAFVYISNNKSGLLTFNTILTIYPFSLFFGYSVFIISGIPFYLYEINPFTHHKLLQNPFFYKILYLLTFLSLNYPIILTNFNLDISSLKDIINLSWLIFGIQITLVLVTYIYIIQKFEDKRKNETNISKIYYNLSIQIGLSTYKLLPLNLVFLFWSSLLAYIYQENNYLSQMISKITLLICFNFLGNVIYDFISIVNKKEEQIKFSSNELEIENIKLKEQEEIFKDLKDRIKSMPAKIKKSRKRLKKAKSMVKKVNVINEKFNVMYLEYIKISEQFNNDSSERNAKIMIDLYNRLTKIQSRVQIYIHKFKRTLEPMK